MSSDKRTLRVPRPFKINILIRALGLLLMAAIGAAANAAAGDDAAAEAERAFFQAMLAVETGQWSQAEMHLERCLMFEPEHAEARIQLAILMARRGRIESARILIQSLIDDPRTPEAHRSRLQALQVSLTQMETAGKSAAPVAATQKQTGVEITMGYVRNPFARANIDELTLTLPGGDLTLPVLMNINPAPFLGMTVRHAVQNEWGFEAGIQQFGEPEPKTAGRLWLYRDTVILAQPVRWSGYFMRAIDGTTRQALGVTIPRGDWRLLAGAFNEPESRRGGVTARLERAWSPNPSVWTVTFGEVEQSTFGRAGYGSAGFYAQWVPAPRWMLAGQVTALRDFDGYSTLLQNGATRQLYTANVAAEHFWDLDTDWRLLGRAYVGRRWSNIELFGYKDAGLAMSIQRYWR